MNNQIRKQLNDLQDRITEFRKVRDNIKNQLTEAKVSLENIKNDVESIRDEEQDKFDNLTEGLQQSEKGQAIEAAVTELESAQQALDEYYDAFEIEDDDSTLDTAFEALDNAKA